MIKKLDHVSILTKQPEQVIDFYKTFLGFEVLYRKEVPPMNMNIIMLKARDELLEILQPTIDTNLEDGIKHMAFLSDNIDEDFAFFREKGASLLHKEVQRHDKIALFFCKSPSGELVEVIQYS